MGVAARPQAARSLSQPVHTAVDLTRTLQAPLDEAEAARLRELLADLGASAAPFRFRVAPNPCVGAAVLSNGVEVGRGFHREWGGSHAELHALDAAAESGVPRKLWDTLVITLEPCSSNGKTPPCTTAILDAGIRRVVVGALDPDPRHRGRGLELLHDKGVEIVHLRGASPLASVAPHFVRWTDPDRLRRPRPWTIAKWAQTRTGQLSPPKDVGEGRWISCSAALAEVQVLRSQVDAIVTGIGTVLADDPRLTLRGASVAAAKPPVRIVLDSHLRTSPQANLLRLPEELDADEVGGPVLIVSHAGADPTRYRALEERGAEIVSVKLGDDGRPSLRALGRLLWERGMRRILVEAGPSLLESWFQVELIDQLRVYTGSVNGGRGRTLAAHLAPERFDDVDRREVGEDAVLEAFLRR